MIWPVYNQSIYLTIGMYCKYGSKMEKIMYSCICCRKRLQHLSVNSLWHNNGDRSRRSCHSTKAKVNNGASINYRVSYSEMVIYKLQKKIENERFFVHGLFLVDWKKKDFFPSLKWKFSLFSLYFSQK